MHRISGVNQVRKRLLMSESHFESHLTSYIRRHTVRPCSTLCERTVANDSRPCAHCVHHAVCAKLSVSSSLRERERMFFNKNMLKISTFFSFVCKQPHSPTLSGTGRWCEWLVLEQILTRNDVRTFRSRSVLVKTDVICNLQEEFLKTF